MDDVDLQLISACDLGLFKSLYCDDEIMHFLSDGMSDAAASDFFDDLINSQNREPPTSIIYKIIDGGDAVGLVGGFFIPSDTKTVHLGAMILKKYQKQGYSTLAIRQFSQKVMQKYGVERITTKSKVANSGASKLMHRLKFELLSVTVSTSGDQYNNWQYNLLPLQGIE